MLCVGWVVWLAIFHLVSANHHFLYSWLAVVNSKFRFQNSAIRIPNGVWLWMHNEPRESNSFQCRTCLDRDIAGAEIIIYNSHYLARKALSFTFENHFGCNGIGPYFTVASKWENTKSTSTWEDLDAVNAVFTLVGHPTRLLAVFCVKLNNEFCRRMFFIASNSRESHSYFSTRAPID